MTVIEYFDIRTLVLLGFGFKLMASMIAGARHLRVLLGISLLLDAVYLTTGELLVLAATPSHWVLLAMNLLLLAAYLRGHTTLGFNQREKRLFKAFETLTPGQFRQVMRAGQMKTVTAPTEVIRQSTYSTQLFYVEGFRFGLQKGDQQSEAKGPAFVGEISFLTGEAASATVIFPPGTPYVEWQVAELHDLMHANSGLKNALVARFSLDLAAKVARSMPVPR